MEPIRGETAPQLGRVKPWKAFLFLLLHLPLFFPFFSFFNPPADLSVLKHGFQFSTTTSTASNSSLGWWNCKRVEPQAPRTAYSHCWAMDKAGFSVSGAIQIDSRWAKGSLTKAKEGNLQSYAKDNFQEIELVLPRQWQIPCEWEEKGAWRPEEVCHLLRRFRAQRAGAAHPMQPYVPWGLHCSLGEEPWPVPSMSVCNMRPNETEHSTLEQ